MCKWIISINNVELLFNCKLQLKQLIYLRNCLEAVVHLTVSRFDKLSNNILVRFSLSRKQSNNILCTYSQKINKI